MLKNERGNTLITVLLMSLVFTVLGMSILAASLGGAKRTETRESDISITYNSVKVIDQMTSELAGILPSLPLEDYRRKNIEGKLYVRSDFDIDLKNKLKDDLIAPYKTEDNISCLNIIDLSGSSAGFIDSSAPCMDDISNYDTFNIERENDFTRVLDIIIVTKNPVETEGKITRTLRKRIILSPLPSFLKYAAGSFSDENDSGLILNGSANFSGNVYANRLTINEDAEYELRDGSKEKTDTNMSSISGDLYSSTANLLPLLIKENFYKEHVPELKHDSQFINIDFDRTMNEQANELLSLNGIPAVRAGNGSTFSEEIKSGILSSFAINTLIKEQKKQSGLPEILQELGNNNESDIKSYLINTPEDASLLNGLIQGDVVIMAEDTSLELNEKLIVDGDLYLVNFEDLTIYEDILVTGRTHLVNFNGKLEVNENIISANDIIIESYAHNKDELSSKGIKVNGDILSGRNTAINALNTSIEMTGTIISNGSFTINGDETGEPSENDQVIFDSVVYAGKRANISNVNILGLENNTKQLVLMAKDDLLLTRINEFGNFDPDDEAGMPYVPEDETIKPLKGFFYTEKDAELYGVGSLFYINGGIFAKEKLIINAIRGEVKSIEELPSRSSQLDKYSRFIVNYDQNVLLQRIDTLPIVKHLQIFSDELLIE
ncbi:hypothetical protein ACOSZF_04235 [Cytobacillus firmus]|uniref:hypothetical protein n=1 Tax=Cytobacillus firmus TaxID=1399 RepID=UPI0018CDCD31|nr:hypothetical protein [Cytobacillus firmus]MBG9655668.1 hypothetical protein [Cytobacillus firmus]MED1906363.1 hypothetical protein [Cytobacillus firmus]